MPHATGTLVPTANTTPPSGITPVVDYHPRNDPAWWYVTVFLARYRPRTREMYACRMGIWFRWCHEHRLDPINGVARAHIELYARWLEEERRNSSSSVHGAICMIRAFYRLLAIDGYIPVSPAEYVRVPVAYVDPTRIMGVGRTEIMTMLHTAKRMSVDHSALMQMLAVLGLRISEALSITPADTRHEERGHRVMKFTGKAGKRAAMPLPVAVARELDMAAEGRPDDERLVRKANGQPPTRDAASRMVRAVAREAGITARITPHVLRHSMVSNMLEAGASLRTVQIAARHADPSTTAMYDTARHQLDNHGVHTLSAYLSGGS